MWRVFLIPLLTPLKLLNYFPDSFSILYSFSTSLRSGTSIRANICAIAS
jgi:hypothetical protein